MNTLERKVLDLSYKNKLTHVSSCLNTVNVLADIYEQRKENEPVVLANSHAALALYVVLESKGFCDAQEMIDKHGTHAGRDMEHGIWCSGGSLGCCEPIAVGMALADRERTVWLVTSDGSCMEGSVHEAFRIARELMLDNLRIYLIANGYGAYRRINVDDLQLRFIGTDITVVRPKMPFKWLEGLDGHYLTISDEQYAEVQNS